MHRQGVGGKQTEQKAIPRYRCVLEFKIYKQMKSRRVHFLCPTKLPFLRAFTLYFYREMISDSRHGEIEK